MASNHACVVARKLRAVTGSAETPEDAVLEVELVSDDALPEPVAF